MRACGCLSPWAWYTYEVRASSPGRLVLFDRKGRRHEPDEPCTRWFLLRQAFGGKLVPFYSLAPGEVARGEWTNDAGCTAQLTRNAGR